MTVLDTFYTLFKSNADEYAKGVSKATKAEKELEDQSKKTDEQTEKLGKNFVKVVEGATEAAAAIFSFGAIKAGLINAKDFNSALEVQGKIMNQSVQDMRTLGVAVQAAGGSVDGFQGSLKGMYDQAAAVGLKLPPALELMQRMHDQLKDVPDQNKAYFLQKWGVTDPGMILLLKQSDEEYARSIALAREHAKVSEHDAQVAREFQKQTDLLSQSWQSFYTTIGGMVLPIFGKLAEGLANFLNSANDSKLAAAGLFGVLVAGASSFAVLSARTIAGMVGIGGAAGTALTGISAIAAGTLALISRFLVLAPLAWDIGKAIAAIFNPAVQDQSFIGRTSQKIANWLDNTDAAVGKIAREGADRYVEWRTPPQNNYPTPRPASGPMKGQFAGNEKDSMAFWISQGYTPAQAAGLVANEKRESGFNPGAIGDGGKARGIFQWHGDRRQAILAATGIDVSSSSHADQLRAAAWEIKNMGLEGALKSQNSADATAALFSLKFERPANGAMEAYVRGQSALAIAQNHLASASNPAGAGGHKEYNIKIDDITVHSQATDAKGVAADLGAALENQFRMTVSNFDDGVQN